MEETGISTPVFVGSCGISVCGGYDPVSSIKGTANCGSELSPPDPIAPLHD
jgi:hypothetical protein